MAITNPIQYTSRTFQTVLNDINADAALVDKPDWFKRLVAGIMDVLSVIENATANQSFLRTAFTRRAVFDLAALIDYNPPGQVESSGTQGFDFDPAATPPFTVARAQLAALSSGGAAPLRFSALANITVASFATEVTAFGVWNTGTDRITVATPFVTGEKIRLTFSATPPTTIPQVVAGTDYYVIAISTVLIKLATSRANAFAGTAIDITAQGTGNHTLTRYTRFVGASQMTAVAPHSIGKSDGTTPWQTFIIGQAGVVRSTLNVVINSVTWTRVDTLVNSLPSDTHYRLYYNTDGSALILFGDGTYGAIPGAFDVTVDYYFGGGAASNVSILNSITNYAGSDSKVTGTYNPTIMSGGADAQQIEVTKRIAPLLLKTRDRFVTVEDGEALALGYGGLGQVKINPDVWGPLSCQVLGIANGGGDAPAPLRATIQQFLIDRSILESIDVQFTSSTITSVAVTSAAKMKSGFLWANVQPYFTLAWRLFFSEVSQEVLDTYLSSGVVAVTAFINTVFGTAFGSADYTAITRLMDLMEPRNFGDEIFVSDAYSFCQGGVAGIDYMTITTPASWPIVLADDEITTDGTMTLTEIT